MSAAHEVLVEKQKERYVSICSSVDNLLALESDKINKAQIQTRLKILEANWEKFQAANERFTNARLTDVIRATPYFTEGMYSKCEEKYADSRGTMLNMLDKLCQPQPELKAAEQSPNNVKGHSHQVRSLPNIELPTFRGDYQHWRSFHDLFTSMISNSTQLSDVEKFHYLKTSLKDEAALLIANISVSSENFARAWDTLVASYENKRLLVDTHLDKIFRLKPIQRKSASDLKKLLAVTKESLGALNLLGAPTQHWDYIIVYIIVRRLDPSSHEAWEVHRGASTNPASFNDLESFLGGRIRALEIVETRSPICSTDKASRSENPSSKKYSAKIHVASTESSSGTSQTSNLTQKCFMCNKTHYISACPAYINLNSNQRHEFLVEKGLCFNCLGPHRIAACRSTKRCFLCDKQHHTSIHRSVSGSHQTQSTASTSSKSNIDSNNQVVASRQNNAGVETLSALSHQAVPQSIAKRVRTLLATALVRICSSSGTELQFRALIDPGSQLTIISESATQQLHLKRQRACIPLYGVGAQLSGTTKGIVNFTLKPHFTSTLEWDVAAHILPKPTADLPSLELDHGYWSHLHGLTLADPSYLHPGQIDLVIGIDIYSQLIEPELVKGPPGTPFARRTGLGWIISGPVTRLSQAYPYVTPMQIYQCSTNNDLLEAIQRFWLQEEIQVSTPLLSKEEEDCENHFLSTHSRNAAGRYIVRLPFKNSPNDLGTSQLSASRMLSRMIAKLNIDSTLKTLYSDFLQEYLAQGHMRHVSDDIPEPQYAYYLPHHGVLKESSTSTKLRVVFNGSSRSTSGQSLNDLLHTGKKLQSNLSDIITWWRQFPYVFSADMEKMFRQILVHEDDWDFQRILWSPTLKNDSVRKYQLTTVTYGLGPAPFLANRVIQQLRIDEGHRFPLAANVLKRGTYVDDCFGGADSPYEARQLAHQLNMLCMAGGFKLLKWTSNDPDILSDLSADRLATSGNKYIDGNPLFKALGVAWQPNSDAFVFSIPWDKDNTPPTKRKVLSQIARLFDPLGWLAPVTIRAKILMQALWLEKAGWDDELSISLSSRWNDFINQLEDITLIRIPRWIGLFSGACAVEIHGFSDASQDAMAAVLYLRVLKSMEDVQISLIAAKTKVSPIDKTKTKKMTIPRLELGAAAMLTKLAAHMQKTLNLIEAPVHLWTDSSVTLTWIKSHPSRWKDYVQNRVIIIQDTLPGAKWHHVSGKENPADCASRGVSPRELSGSHLWWNGPRWLSQHSTSWPTAVSRLEHNVDLEERAQVSTAYHNKEPKLWDIIDRFSKLNLLIRITATCQRAIKILRKESLSLKNQPLTTEELEAARLYWVKLVQKAYFSSEIFTLTRGHDISNKNPLIKLIPFLDSTGLLRVGGRLRNSLLDPDTKHPLILPRNSSLTELIIRHAHVKTLHGGTQVTLAYLRRSYWILGGRTPVRSFILRCVTCARYRGITAKQLMGQLPSTRIIPSRPFLNSGVDYAGPLTLRTWRGRSAKTYKGYIVLFVCFSTSAVHLEIATDYSTEGFLAAYKRFSGRRGICATLHSDCGTNLIGADAELRRLFSSASQQLGNLKCLLANDGTQWLFNPPSSPHFGGKWEAGVKSVKFHLRRVIGENAFTYEELSTLLVQIEAVLNSRPLCPLSDDPDDIEALTPGHFLTGSALNTLPEPSISDSIPLSRLSRFQLIRQMLDRFWTRWSSEYIQRFQSISKWKQVTDPIQKNSLVLIVDERYPPAKWLLGRIMELHPGCDGLTRVVTVKTKNSILKRPVVKLCLLPIRPLT